MFSHLLSLVPFVGVFLFFLLVWRKGLAALVIVSYSLGQIFYMFIYQWEWFCFPIVAITGLFSLYAFIKLAMEGELV